MYSLSVNMLVFFFFFLLLSVLMPSVMLFFHNPCFYQSVKDHKC